MSSPEKSYRRIVHPILQILRFAFVVAFAALLLFALSTFWLTHPVGENWIRGILEERLTSSLGQAVSVDSLETNLFNRLNLYGVTVYSTDTLTSRSPLTLEYARVNYRLPELIGDSPFIRNVAIGTLALTLRSDSSGLKDFRFLQHAVPVDTSKTRKPIRQAMQIRRLTITNGSLAFQDKSLPLNLDLDGLQLTLQSRGQGYGVSLLLDTLHLNHQGWSFPLSALSGEGSLQQNQVVIDTLAFRLPELTVGVSGGVDLSSQGAIIDLRAELSGSLGSLADLEKQKLPHFLGDLSGDIALQAHLAGNISHPDIEGKLNASDLHIARNPTLSHAEITGSIRNGVVQMDTLSIEALDGTLRGSGSLQISSPFTHSLHLTLKDIDAGSLWQAYYDEPSPYNGIINGQLATRGPLSEPARVTLAIHVRGDNSRFRGKAFPPLLLDGTLIGGRASFHMVQGGAIMDGDGWMRERRIGGSFRAVLPSIAPFTSLANLQELEGKLELGGSVSGTLERPRVKARIRASSLSYRNLPIDTLAASLRWQDSKFSLDSAYAAHQLQEVDTLHAPFGLERLRGKYGWTLKLSGTPDQPKGRLEARFVKPSWGKTRLDALQMLLMLDGNTIKLLTLQAQRGALGMTIDGEWKRDTRSGNATATLYNVPKSPDDRDEKGVLYSSVPEKGRFLNSLGQIHLQTRLMDEKRFTVQASGKRIDLMAFALAEPRLRTLAGLLDLKATVEYSGGDVQSDLEIGVQRPSLATVHMDSLHLHMNIDPKALRLDTLSLFRDDSRFLASGLLNFPIHFENKRDRLQASTITLLTLAEGVDLQLLAPFLPLSTELRGIAGWQLDMGGTLARPRIHGSVKLRDGYYKSGVNGKPIEDLNLTLRFTNRSYVVDRLAGITYNLPFELQGKGTFDGLNSLTTDFNLALNGENVLTGEGRVSRDSVALALDARMLNLQSVAPLLRGVEDIGGSISSLIKIEGSLENPSFYGQISARHVEIKREQFGLSLSGGSADMRFEGHRLIVDSLSADFNGGRIFVRGDMDLVARQIQSATFDTRLENVRYERQGIFVVKVDTAQLTYQRLREDLYKLSGTVNFGETRIMVDLPVQRLLEIASQADRPKPELPPLFQKTTLDVRVVNRDQFWISNNLARIRNRVDMDFSGPLTQPSLSGRVAVQEGYLIYLDRKFEIDTGILDFTNPRHINPFVTLSATAKLKSYQTRDKQAYTILFTAQGPLDQAQIDLQSTPALDRSDILALLTLGSTRHQLTGNLTLTENNALISVIQQRAENLSSQRISGYVSNRVGSMFGLEEMSIEGNLFNFGDNWGPQLLASKQLSNRVRVTYSTRVGHLNEQGIRLDYQLTNKWSIESQADQQGGTGVDLKYRVRFK
ncbi:MAG: translocation/assembly module TamB domain-containing protein [bacterium]